MIGSAWKVNLEATERPPSKERLERFLSARLVPRSAVIANTYFKAGARVPRGRGVGESTGKGGVIVYRYGVCA